MSADFDDDDDDDFDDNEDVSDFQHGYAEPAPMHDEQQSPGPHGLYLEDRTVMVFEHGELKFRTSDPHLFREVRQLEEFADDARVAVLRELIEQAEHDRSTPNISQGYALERHIELLTAALKAAEQG